MKTTLSIEESAKLIDLGVDPRLASEDKVTYDKNDKPYHHPIYSLADLLSILPKEINHQCLTIVSTDKLYFARYGKWEKEYIHSWQETFTPNDDCGKNSAPELIDALYQLLIWCLEQGYGKCGKGGGK